MMTEGTMIEEDMMIGDTEQDLAKQSSFFLKEAVVGFVGMFER